MKDQIDSMQGQLMAISMILTALIRDISPTSAANMAAELTAMRDREKVTDWGNELPPKEALSRDTILEAYIELLNAVSSSAR